MNAFRAPMESWAGLGWVWRALRGRSITFAALFAVTLLGFSVISGLRHLLNWLDAPLLAWLLLPAFLIGVLARKELEWMPDERQRLKWARALILGSIATSMLTAALLPKAAPNPQEPVPVRTLERPRPPGR